MDYLIYKNSTMKNRIDELFAKRQKNILSIFYTAGFPRLEDTASIAGYLEAAGVDLIEIGIPFSDPIADGPVIQESNKIALDNGMTVKKLLEQVREIRKKAKLPIILMGYLNPAIQYGIEKFCSEASAAGVDGLIFPDMPMAEYLDEYKVFFESSGLTSTFLISPTTSEARIRQIDEATTGFVYAVSASSTTGAKGEFSPEQESYFKKLKGLKMKSPFLIGFGISSKATFATACEFGSGAIIGSAFISQLKTSSDLQNDITRFITSIRA